MKGREALSSKLQQKRFDHIARIFIYLQNST